MKIVAWNVNRKSLEKIELSAALNFDADIMAFQEIRPKANSAELSAEISASLLTYLPLWCNIGHGLAMFTHLRDFNNLNIDFDGLVMTFEYEKFYFVNVSAPSISYIGEEDFWDWNRYFKNFINRLHKNKPVIAGGTFNFGTNPRNISPAEEKAMTKLLSIGLVDVFAEFNPDKEAVYTFHNKLNDVKSRIDYFFVSDSLKGKVISASIVEEDFGSAHRPIILDINI